MDDVCRLITLKLSLYFLLCLIIAATEISRVCMLRKFKKTILKNRQDMVNKMYISIKFIVFFSFIDFFYFSFKKN